jgi:hypothetical protein
MLGKQPLAGGAITELISRLSFFKDRDREQLRSAVVLPAPAALQQAAPSGDGGALVQEVKRQALPDDRCAAWLQTDLQPGAPASTSSGVLVIVARHGESTRVEAATRFHADEGTLGFGRSRSYGVVTLYVAEDDTVGTGAQERGHEECIWAVSKDRVTDALCYFADHSFSPISGAGWRAETETKASFSANGVVLHRDVSLVWQPPSESQKNCKPTWLDDPDTNWLQPHTIAYKVEHRYELAGIDLTEKSAPTQNAGGDEIVPKWVADQVAKLNLPPVGGTGTEIDAALDCNDSP